MNKKLSLKTIAPRDLWNVFRGCVWIIIASAIIVTGVFYAIARYNYSPTYSSKATMYLIGKTDGTSNFNQVAADYTLALKVMSDCDYLLKSRTVLNAVGKDLGWKDGEGYSRLRGRITIANPEGTRVLEVSATAGSPEQAQKIVDSVCTHGIEYINEILAYDRLYVFEEATYSEGVINTVSLTSYLKYGAVAAVLVYIIFLAMFLFDNYIHTEDDIERYLGLTILGDIPDADAPQKKSKYKYGKYKSYRYYKRRGYRYHSNYSVKPSAYTDANANAKGKPDKE